MRMMNVQELPYPHDKILTLDEINTVKTYCCNDIDATLKLYQLSKSTLENRIQESYRYKTDLLSFNDSKFGEFTAKYYISREIGTDDFGKSIYDYIDLKDVIFDYISFETEPFNRILEFFKNQRITNEIKGIFNKIPFDKMSILDGYYLRKEIKSRGESEVKQEDLNILYNGFKIVYGLGGFHGSVDRQIIESNSEYIIVDVDVGGYYPSLAICNRFYPKHLSEKYCDVLAEKKRERDLLLKSDPQSNSIKLMMNSCFGKSNEEFSFLYDRAYFLKTTINGQLLLSKLIETICENTDSKLLQCNTDGASFYVNRKHLDLFLVLCKDWESFTKGLTLEIVYYKKMILRDVNNYLWISEEGKIKKKGAYATNPELHKNHSKLIVPKAVEAYFTTGIPVEEFIRNHDDIFDFFLRVKLKEGSKLIATRGEEVIPLTKLTRYLVTNSGYTLLKLLSGDRTTNIEKGFLCTPCNYLTDEIITALKSDINYDYYIEKAQKLLVGEDDELEEN